MRAIGYVRVSTAEQAAEGVSLDAQRARIAAWAHANAAELTAVYTDAGLSGGRADNRPGLQAALDAACTAKAALVVYSLSRLARSTRDAITISERLDSHYEWTRKRGQVNKALVASVIDKYCHKVWSKIHGHCHDSEIVILTGGGTCIPRVREYFDKKLKQAGVANVVAFSVSRISGAGTRRHDRLCEWQSSGEGLGRLATGLGGASIAYGFCPDEECLRFVPRGRNPL
jgi:hypothetical protein